MDGLEDDWTTLLASERENRIRGVLDQFRSQGSLYLDPEIPARKLANARASMQVPSDERVLGLIDATSFGSAKNGVAFGERAVYFHNSWTVNDSKNRGRGMLEYPAFAQLELAKGWMEVKWPGGAIEASGSSFSAVQMLDLLRELQRAIKHGLPQPSHGTYIAAHLIDRSCLEPTNEVWPSGIATRADASIVTPSFALQWALDLPGDTRAVAIARDFVVALAIDGNAFRLLGLELTSGREFWRRELPFVSWSSPVIALGHAMLKGGPYWHAFDLETGEPRQIDVPSLPRTVRDQLVLADVEIGRPERYAGFARELAHPYGLVPTSSRPPLLCANHVRRVYGVRGGAVELRIVDEWTAHDIATAYPDELTSWAMNDRYLLLGTRETGVHVVDAGGAPVIVSVLELTDSIGALAIGSDHVVVAGGNWLRCYRG